jgi:hypothetical protein
MEITAIIKALEVYLIALFGGLVGYLLRFKKEKEIANEAGIKAKLDYTHMFIYIIVGGFMGSIIDPAIPKDLDGYRGAIIGVTSMFAIPLTSIIESRLIKIINKKFDNLEK